MEIMKAIPVLTTQTMSPKTPLSFLFSSHFFVLKYFHTFSMIYYRLDYNMLVIRVKLSTEYFFLYFFLRALNQLSRKFFYVNHATLNDSNRKSVYHYNDIIKFKSDFDESQLECHQKFIAAATAFLMTSHTVDFEI